MKSLTVDIDAIHLCLSKGASLHPLTEHQFMATLNAMHANNTICLLPLIILNQYDNYITDKIKSLIWSLPKHEQHRITKKIHI